MHTDKKRFLTVRIANAPERARRRLLDRDPVGQVE
jgi:hypothetical protein